jgi:hypothetical protein
MGPDSLPVFYCETVSFRYHDTTQLEESSGNCELREFGRFSDRAGGMEVIDEDGDDDANGDDDDDSDGDGSSS